MKFISLYETVEREGRPCQEEIGVLLARPGDSDDDGEVPEHQHATSKKLPPLFVVRRLIEKRQASDD